MRVHVFPRVRVYVWTCAYGRKSVGGVCLGGWGWGVGGGGGCCHHVSLKVCPNEH